ncbi:MAG: threonylcarbamoyl-AMP synthase [Sphingobacteriales bacterium]|nr:MAG: threonylcarbamoyl-AMP synthase [Sphingobacteriales bacterium]
MEKDISNCIKTLSNSGVILYPTDTVWGLGCDALNEQAVEKVFDVKKRPKNKSLIVLLAEPRDVLQYVANPHPDIIDILENFDRPTTVIFDGALEFPENVVGSDGSVAIRITSDLFCKALIKRFRKPIISTSANISGEPTAPLFKDVSDRIKQGVDYIVEHRQQDEEIKAPSRLVKILEDGSLEILRA